MRDSLLSFTEAAIGTQEWPFLELAKKKVCKDVTHLEKLFQDILEKGGEGVILRDPHCPYQPGRSAGYLKHKVLSLTHYYAPTLSKLLEIP